jgi:hypothetical protein
MSVAMKKADWEAARIFPPQQASPLQLSKSQLAWLALFSPTPATQECFTSAADPASCPALLLQVRASPAWREYRAPVIDCGDASHLPLAPPAGMPSSRILGCQRLDGMTQDDAPQVQDWRGVARWYAQG